MKDFAPIPAPHPLCETNAYLLMPEVGAPIPLTRVVPRERYFELVVNQAILRPDERLEERIKEVIDYLYAVQAPDDEQKRALATFRSLLARCFPVDGSTTAEMRERMCERAIKAVFLIPYMDEYNLDLTRLRSCVSMQATPDGRLIPNCAYYPLHRLNDPRFFPKGKLPMFTAAATGKCGS